MKFRTEYTARPSAHLLDPEKPAVLIGSCFTDNIGARMQDCRWRAFPNICGTLYNPRSIANILRMACADRDPSAEIETSLAQRDGLWVSWLMDSECTTRDRQDTKERVRERLCELRKRMAEARTLVVTFGTAWVYELGDSPGYVVSNCHKFHPDTFIRRRLTVTEIVEEWVELIVRLRRIQPDIDIILTVSPVRHLKDGFEGNSRSKATLLLACEELCRAAGGRVGYFPAYEILNDDLRDYRFYASDMVHPSPQAVEYLWEKFQERYLTPASRALLAEGEKITRRLNHRPIIQS